MTQSLQECLPAEALSELQHLPPADIVVGIPSYNNARTIPHVIHAIQAGLAKYFPAHRSVIINSDGGSRDGTPQIVRDLRGPDAELLLISHPLHTIHRLSTPYHGLPGKGSAVRCIFRAAQVLNARACAVVDSDLRSIAPEWIQLLVYPVLEDRFDYVAPYYARHKYDGTITNSIVYPLTRALYGCPVRQPIGGDFGFSGRLAEHFLSQPVWESDVARFGIDIWMTTTAICGGFRVCQAFLGAKIHDAKDPGADLADMLVQVLGSVFSLTETHQAIWEITAARQECPVLGFRFGVGLEPVSVDIDRMLNRFRHGVNDLAELWKPVLAPTELQALRELAQAPAATFRLDDTLWARLVYSFAAGFHHRVMDRQHLVKSFLPLYLGRVSSFVMEVADFDTAAVEERIEQLCRCFEDQKDYLRARWHGREAQPPARAAAQPELVTQPVQDAGQSEPARR